MFSPSKLTVIIGHYMYHPFFFLTLKTPFVFAIEFICFVLFAVSTGIITQYGSNRLLFGTEQLSEVGAEGI